MKGRKSCRNSGNLALLALQLPLLLLLPLLPLVLLQLLLLPLLLGSGCLPAAKHSNDQAMTLCMLLTVQKPRQPHWHMSALRSAQIRLRFESKVFDQ